MSNRACPCWAWDLSASLVAKLNADDRFHGIWVQLPLPPKISERTVILTLDPNNDVDGLHPLNVGLLLQYERIAPNTDALYRAQRGGFPWARVILSMISVVEMPSVYGTVRKIPISRGAR